MNWDLIVFCLFGLIGLALIAIAVSALANLFSSKREVDAFWTLLFCIGFALVIFGFTFDTCDTGLNIRDKTGIWPPWTPAEKVGMKIKQLKELHEALKQKLIEVQDLQEEYKQGEIDAGRDAIAESNARSIRTFDQAMKDAHISYDIKLIQRRNALSKKMGETAIGLGYGIEQVRYLEMNTEDELGIAKVFTSEEAQKLMKDINFTIDQYQPDAQEINLQLDEKQFIPPDKIWDWIQRERQKQ